MKNEKFEIQGYFLLYIIDSFLFIENQNEVTFSDIFSWTNGHVRSSVAFHAPSSTASSLVITNSLRSALFSSLHQLKAVSFHVFCYDHFISFFFFIFLSSIKIYILYYFLCTLSPFFIF